MTPEQLAARVLADCLRYAEKWSEPGMYPKDDGAWVGYSNALAAITAENARLRDRLARMEGALRHEVKRSRRHLAASTLAVLVEADAAPADGGKHE